MVLVFVFVNHDNSVARQVQYESKFRECAVHNEVSYNNWKTVDLNTAQLDHAQTDFRTVPSRP